MTSGACTRTSRSPNTRIVRGTNRVTTGNVMQLLIESFDTLAIYCPARPVDIVPE